MARTHGTPRWNRRRICRGVLVACALFPLLVPGGARAQGHFPLDPELETMLRLTVEDGATPGMVLGVVEADGTGRVVSFGTAGPGARPLSAGSVFEIGSITKTFTATLLADMVARGEVALHDPVAMYLPDHVTVPSRGEREITLLDLATHTSGLPRNPENHRPPDLRDPWASYTVEILYGFLSGYELPRDPGAEYEYSNLGFGLLGHALARAAGQPFEELLRERILEPLGMERTGYDLEGSVAEWMVRGHANGVPRDHRTVTEAIQGAGGLRSSGRDMARYLAAQLGPPRTRLEEAMRAAQEVRFPMGSEVAGAGLAWRTSHYPNELALVAHGGSTGAFRAWIGMLPDAGIGAFWLVNTGDFHDDGIGAALLYPEPPPTDWRAADGPGDLDRFVGTYAARGGGEYFIGLDGTGQLTYQRRGLVRARLYPRSDTSFYMLRGPWTISFRENDPGGTLQLVMEVDEREPAVSGERRIATRVAPDTPSSIAVAGNAGLVRRLDHLARRAYLRAYAWGPVAWAGLGILLLVGVGLLVRRIRAA